MPRLYNRGNFVFVYWLFDLGNLLISIMLEFLLLSTRYESFDLSLLLGMKMEKKNNDFFFLVEF